ncbi:MAG TPA: DUF3152 domain-containing protein, partial [Nonomuraea sp.]|nr:DUF3152 domain-containing protein [Nonomuraea sp.]
TVSGVLTDAAGAPVVGASVVAGAPGPAGVWTVVAGPAATDAAGAVALTVQPTVSMSVRLRHDTGDPAADVSSLPVTVSVQAVLTAVQSVTAVRVGRPVTIGGTLAPAPAGAEVRVERRIDGAWRPLVTTPVDPDGTWSVAVRPTYAGSLALRAVRATSGGVLGATVELEPLDVFRVHRYSVTTRGRVTAHLGAFRVAVASTYADPRGWARAHHRFREVARGGDFTVVLSQASLLPSFSRQCSSMYSCRVGRYVIINQDRWRRGSPYFPGDLTTYRQMLVNHETGHWLGRGHAYCRGDGRLAPVMQQQSKGMQGCRVNPWPLRRELRAVS